MRHKNRHAAVSTDNARDPLVYGDLRMAREFRSADERRAAIVALTQQETGIDEATDRDAGSGLLRPGAARPAASAHFRAANLRLGAASRQHVRVLVVADPSDRPLSRPADGEAHALGRRRCVTSIDGLRCSKKRRVTFVRPPRRSGSSNGLTEWRRAWSLGSRAQTESC